MSTKFLKIHPADNVFVALTDLKAGENVNLNGKPYLNSYIDHSILLKGGSLEFTMGAKPNMKFGSEPGNRPSSATP